MSPSAHPPRHHTASTASRRVVLPPSGSTAPGVGHPEFEDFMNAYRPNLEGYNQKVEKPQPVKDDSKPDFGRSIKRLMKRGQPSPGTSTKREGIQRTPLDRERSVANELRPPASLQSKKAVRPSSAILEPSVQHSPSLHRVAINAHSAAKSEPIPPQRNKAKGSSSSSSEVGQRSPVEFPVTSMPLPLTVVSEPSPGSTRRKISAQDQQQHQHQHSEKEVSRIIQPARATPPPTPPVESYCLLFTRDSLERFLPPRRTPDVMLGMRVVEVPDRKFRVIMEFDEGPQPPVPQSAQSGLQLQPDRPEEWEHTATWDLINAFSSVREARIACNGLLLVNVERWSEFPFVTYLVVNGGTSDLINKVNQLRTTRIPNRSPQHMHFTTGFGEIVTLCQPPFPSMPERPVSDRSGFVVALYQVLSGEDGQKFEKNWGTWTGARHLYCHMPEYMGLKRMSLHKSLLPSSIVLYSMVCEFTAIMDHVTEACVLVDQLRARCCGSIGIYRILDSL